MWYNKDNSVKKNLFKRKILSILLPLFLASNLRAEETLNDFFLRVKSYLEKMEISYYLETFAEEKRTAEEMLMEEKLEKFQIEKISLFKANIVDEGEEARLYARAIFQNSYLVLIETWSLFLSRIEGKWQIKNKIINSDVKELYKIKIPSERIERIRQIEITHTDIKLSFEDCLVLYDNIPQFETALLILGKGKLNFSPSDPKERHQIQLIYKEDEIRDDVKYAYLRFSDFFFKKNIKIVEESEERKNQFSAAEINRAYSLFKRHYHRSFTILDPLTGEILSFLPQGDEAVIEFEGEKIGRFSYIYSPFSREEINFFKWEGEKILNLYSPRAIQESRRIFISFGQMFDVERYQIEVDFDPKESYLSARAKVEIKSHVKALDGAKFKINPDLQILRIFDQKRRELYYTQDKLRKILYVYFVEPPLETETISIEIFYRGKLLPPAQTADVFLGPPFQEKGLNFPVKYDTYLFSQSSYWYPAPPEEGYFKARLKIMVPPEYTCISNGEMVEKGKVNGVERVEAIDKVGRAFYVFETHYPLKYLTFIVGKFTKVHEDFSPIPLEFFVSQELRTFRKEIPGETKDILSFFEDKFGAFPFEKMSIIKREWSTSGGHSPASFIVLNELPRFSVGSRIIYKSPVDLSRWDEYFLAHEIAHQWWGQGVTWKTYHDQWLSEGMAQFSAILYLEKKYGERAFSLILKKLSDWTVRKSKWGAISMGSRLSYFDFDAYQAIIYNKASLVLFMLRDYLGEGLFFKCIREFFERHKYGSSSTADFMNTLEEVSGVDLSQFSKMWFDSFLLPEVKVSYSLQREKGEFILKFSIRQLKEKFVFPLWLEWEIGGKRIRERIIVNEIFQEFDFSLKEKPKKIVINPDSAVPGKFH